MATSLGDDHELFTYLDNHHMRFDDWGVLVALSEDREAIFFCPLYNDVPERDGAHFNWGQVTAPEPEFLDKVNRIFGTSFRYEDFAGR